MMKQKNIFYVLCLALLMSCDGKKEGQKSFAEYKTMTVESRDEQLASRYTATVKGEINVDVRPQVSGLITESRIAEGQKVKKGQVLFVIDQVPYHAALNTARAKVESAQARVSTATLKYNSKVELQRENVVSDYDVKLAKGELQEAQAALSQARAELLNARNNLSYTYVKSPADGVTSMITYKIGTLVSPQIEKPLVTVVKDSNMQVYFSVTEAQLNENIRRFGSVEKMIAGLPAVGLELGDGTIYPHNGRIDAVSGMVNNGTGAVMLRATFSNPERLLRNDSRATLILPYEKKNSIVVPQSATFEVQDKKFVYKVVDGFAVQTPVEVFRIDDGKNYIVESGLQRGETIVADGAGLLRDGQPVTAEAAAKKTDKKQASKKK